MPLSRLLLLAAFVAAPLAAQTTHTVTVSDLQFDPAELTINAGDTVVWENVGGFHNVNGTTATFPGNPVSFGNAIAGAPWTYTFTFDTVGDYDYRCDAHPAMMQGAITVQTPSAAEDGLPSGASLSDPAPNPFRGTTSFSLTLAATAPVQVAGYAVLGREVATLHDGPLEAGVPVPFAWAPASAVRTGLFVVRIEGPTVRAARKVLLVR